MKRIGTLITRYMSVLVLAAALCAFLWPGACGIAVS